MSSNNTFPAGVRLRNDTKRCSNTNHVVATDKNKTVVYVNQEAPLLTQLYKSDKNIRVVSQLVIFSTLTYLASQIVSDSITAGRFRWRTLEAFGTVSVESLLVSALVITSIHIVSFLIHPLFTAWCKLRSAVSRSIGLLVDIVFLAGYISLLGLSFFYVVVWVYNNVETNLYTRILISTEQVRLCMKTYSFVCENSYKVLYPWHKDDTSGPAVWYKGQMSPTVGSFSQYCYFLYAPTLLYRDHYPRMHRSFNLKSFVSYLLLFILSTTTFIHLLAIVHVKSFHWSDVLLGFISGVPFGFMYALSLSLCVMHSWMNMFAEIMGFGDRTFYTDWWWCTRYDEYYRKWNIVAYHFNHEYTYKDIRKLVGSKYLALFMMFFMSSVIHEYILWYGVGHAVPLITICFAGIGSAVFLFRFGPCGMILTVVFGVYMLLWNIIVERQARMVCPREETMIDVFYPRLFECIVKHSSS